MNFTKKSSISVVETLRTCDVIPVAPQEKKILCGEGSSAESSTWLCHQIGVAAVQCARVQLERRGNAVWVQSAGSFAVCEREVGELVNCGVCRCDQRPNLEQTFAGAFAKIISASGLSASYEIGVDGAGSCRSCRWISCGRGSSNKTALDEYSRVQKL